MAKVLGGGDAVGILLGGPLQPERVWKAMSQGRRGFTTTAARLCRLLEFVLPWDVHEQWRLLPLLVF